MMLDADIVAVSPSSVWRVLSQAGLLSKWNGKPSKKGTGFAQPLAAHQQWHIDVRSVGGGGGGSTSGLSTIHQGRGVLAAITGMQYPGQTTPQYARVMMSGAAINQRRVEHRFYIGVALLMILFNVLAFGPGIIDPSRRNVPLPLTPLVTAHAILSAAWLMLFLGQVTLVVTGHVAVHRRVGIVGAVLAVVFVVVGYFTVVEQARRGFDLSGDISRLAPLGAPPDPAATVALLSFFLMFTVLVGVGLCYRHRPQVHKRLMLIVMLGGLTPTPVAHLVGHWRVLQPWAGVILSVSALIFLSTSAIHDRVSQGRIHRVSFWVPVALFVWQSVFNLVVLPSATWHEFAAWLIR
ncbi:MAG: hypothetical protein ACRD96_12270 [Bryobacteraceae bacterium]